MLRVAGVAKFILSGGQYSINSNDLIAALLVHDLGNIVKFKLASESSSWEIVQKETISKYGAGDYEATSNMLKELGVSDRVQCLVAEMVFGNLSTIIDSSDMSLKIGLYADQRVAPYGVVSLEERFSDLRKRYESSPYKSRFSASQEEKARILEEQIFQGSSLQAIDITDKAIEPVIAVFSSKT